ncbi:MAG: AAA family ATPase [Campylobacterota bacterium]|nr:AAA family ATPase [Campylobacterota bacterium]
MKKVEALITQILDESQRVIIGKERQLKLAIATFLSNGHLLIEDIPGVGKTTLAKTLSRVLGLEYSRVQFTSDLLPSDIIGVNFYNTKDATFNFKKGAIFSQFLLADEINRASSKTQSALLEAMEEHHVSVDGKSYDLPEPFFVIATKNPFEEVGTYELPSSQLDRFSISFSLGYPSFEAEREILSTKKRVSMDELNSIESDDALFLKQMSSDVFVSDEILNLIQEILLFTRESSLYVNGLSTRAAITLINISKSWALLSLRDYVTPSDVLDVLGYVTHHRLISKNEKKTPSEIVDEISNSIHIDT